MDKYAYLNYHTEFSCTGTVNVKLGIYPCFAEAFRKLTKESEVTYKVILYQSSDCFNSTSSNICLFNKHEIRNHLRQLKNLCPFTYRVYSTYHSEHDVFVVKLHIRKVPAIVHKYILTWLRYTYEFPYNVILKDAYYLKENTRFRFTSIATLFNVVSSAYCSYIGDGHSILASVPHIALKVNELRKALFKERRLCDIYNWFYNPGLRIPRSIEGFTYESEEYWSKEYFNKFRRPIYMRMYEEILKRK